MIQLNLLPDVKLEYIKAQQQKRLVLSVSVLMCGLSVALLFGLLAVGALQKHHLSDLSSDISRKSKRLQSTPGIATTLTVQNQLQSLTQLHADKPAASRLFGFLNDVTPTAVSIANFKVDLTTQIATISGSTDTLSSVNKYVDTLKFTKYKTSDGGSETNAFSGVVLENFGLVSPGTSNSSAKAAIAQPATYTISLTFDKTILDITQQVKLVVPNQTTTRSQVSQPTDLFKAAPASPAVTKGTN